MRNNSELTSIRRQGFKPRSIAALLAGALALSLSATTEAGQSHLQAANLQMPDDPSTQLAGAATLMRTRNKVEAHVHASGLDPEAAYTIWWVVFNNPDACATMPCGSTDLRNPNVSGANFYATGFLTGTDGTANVNARLEDGRLPDGVEFIDFGTGVRPQLRHSNGLRAEIHLILRTHGPVVPGLVAEQISTGEFGDCPMCANQQAAVFMPVR